MNPIKKWNQLGLFTRIMVGFVLGIAAGLIFGEKATKLAFLGTILTRLLTMVVAPLVLGLLICSAADVKDFKTLGKIGGKTLGIFLGGTAIAVAIGLVLCNIMQIGAGFVMESAQAYDAKEIPSIVDTLMDIIPTNPFNSLSTQNLLQIIFFDQLRSNCPRHQTSTNYEISFFNAVQNIPAAGIESCNLLGENIIQICQAVQLQIQNRNICPQTHSHFAGIGSDISSA